MFTPAVSKNNPSLTPGAWFVWTRVPLKSEGSAIPFQTIMSTVSESMSALDDASGTFREQFDRCKKASLSLRTLLVDVYPKWTHRPNCTMSMLSSK